MSTLCVALAVFRQTMLKPIKLHRQFCVGIVKIQDAIADGVLPAKLETGKSASTERPPKFLFLIRLIVAKLPGNVFEAHVGMMTVLRNNSSPSP